MNIKELNINDLKPAEYNPRQATAKQEQHLKESLRKFGVVEPILVNMNIDRKFIIIGGHFRVRELKKLGHKTVPCVIVDLNLENEKELNIRLNKNTGEFDFDMLANNFDIDELKDWGFEDFELGMGEVLEAEEDDYEIPDEIKTDIVTGDLFEIGEHRLLCGDSTSFDDVKKLMGDEKADMVFTSPPYNINSGMYETYKDNLKSDEYINFNLEVIKNIKVHLRGILFWNVSYNKNARWEFLEIANRIRTETGFEFLELVVWDKKTALPVVSQSMLTRQYEDIFVYSNNENTNNDIEFYCVLGTEKKVVFYKKTSKIFSNYWEIGTNKTQLKNHLACFPVQLPGKAINLTTLNNEIILDPFIGSGSTMVASHQLKRRCFGCELSEKYCQVIIDRMKKLDNSLIIKKNGEVWNG